MSNTIILYKTINIPYLLKASWESGVSKPRNLSSTLQKLGVYSHIDLAVAVAVELVHSKRHVIVLFEEHRNDFSVILSSKCPSLVEVF